MRCLLLCLATVLHATSPVIVLTPSGDNFAAVLLVPTDMPAGTVVMAIVTQGKERAIGPPFLIGKSGAYPLATVTAGVDVGAYVKTPAGPIVRIQSKPIIRRCEVSRGKLLVFGNFTENPTLVYIDTHPVPLQVAPKDGKLNIPYGPSFPLPFSLTVYQAGGFYDSVQVSLKR